MSEPTWKYAPSPEEGNYELIHPFDLHEVLTKTLEKGFEVVVKLSETVKVEGPYSYDTQITCIDGKRYLATVNVPAKTRNIA